MLQITALIKKRQYFVGTDAQYRGMFRCPRMAGTANSIRSTQPV